MKVFLRTLFFLLVCGMIQCAHESKNASGNNSPSAPPQDGSNLFTNGNQASSSTTSNSDSSSDNSHNKPYNELVNELEGAVENNTLEATTLLGNDEPAPPETIVHTDIEVTLCLSDRIGLVITDSGIMYLQSYGALRLQENTETPERDFIEKIEGISAGFGSNCVSPHGHVKITHSDGSSETSTWYHPAVFPFNLKIYDKDIASKLMVPVPQITPHVDVLKDSYGNLPQAVNNSLDLKYSIMPLDTWQNPAETASEEFTIKLDLSYAQNPEYEKPQKDEKPFSVVDDPSRYIQIQSTVTYNVCISGINALVINEYGMSYMMSLSHVGIMRELLAFDIAAYDLGGNFDSNNSSSCLNTSSITIEEKDITNEGNPELTPQSSTRSWMYPGILPYNLLPLTNPQAKPSITSVESCTDSDNTGIEYYSGKRGDNNFDQKNYLYLLSNINEEEPKSFQLRCDVRFYISKE